MNRLRVWGYVILLVAVGLGNLYFVSSWLTARSLAQIDGDLRGAASQLDDRAKLLAADAGALADAAARAPGVAEPAEGADALAAAEAAVRPVAASLKLDPAAILVGIARGPAQLRAGGQPVTLPDAPLLADAQRGLRRTGWLRAGDRIWMVAAVPAGRAGAAVAGVPLDARVAPLLAPRADATLLVDGKVVASSAKPEVARAVAAPAAAAPRRIVDVGHAGAVAGFLPLPAMPLLFASAPEARAYAAPLEGAADTVVVLSAAMTPFLAGLATYQGAALVVLLLLAALGVVVGLLTREETGRAIPRELLHAADRVSHGDFAARAPALAGSAGVLAAALNRAAEAAEGGRPTPTETGTQPLFPAAPAAEGTAVEAAPGEAADAAPVTVAEPAPIEAPAAPATEPAALDATPSEVPAPAALSGGAVEAAPATPAAREPEPEPLPPVPEPAPGEVPELPPPPPFEPRASEPVAEAAPPAVPAPAAAPAAPAPAAVPLPAPYAADEEESHWRAVFDDFVRTRADTGEAAGPVSYDRFRIKLQKNRDQLVEKYGCRTVRFQVYVKEGKAAVRATPVR